MIHSEHDNIEVMINGEADEVLEELFDSLNKCQNILKSIKGSQFNFNYIQLLSYKFDKTIPNYGRS